MAASPDDREGIGTRSAPEGPGTPPDPLVFRPKRSFGWIWAIALGDVMWLATLPVFLAPEPPPPPITVIMAAIALLAIPFYVTAVFFPKMRYTLTPDALLLTYGPLLRYRIPYGDIDDVRSRDLVMSLWSSGRVPGLALWKVPYSDVGNVFMCSTRALNGVLLIKAGEKLYGISPEDERGFVDALLARVRPTTTVSIADGG